MGLYEEGKTIVVVLCILTVLVSIIYFFESSYTIADLKGYVLSFGPWVPFVLFVIILITSSIGFVSAMPVALAALLLKAPLAFMISVTSLTAGAAISFLIARHIGRDYVERTFIKKNHALKKYDEHLEKRGFWTTVFFRMLYLVPYELVNIACGLSRMDFSKFVLGTLVGIIPTILITIYFIKTTNNYHSVKFFIALLMMTLFAVLPLLSKRIRQIVFNLK